jgi:hypothetical protein
MEPGSVVDVWRHEIFDNLPSNNLVEGWHYGFKTLVGCYTFLAASLRRLRWVLARCLSPSVGSGACTTGGSPISSMT